MDLQDGPDYTLDTDEQDLNAWERDGGGHTFSLPRPRLMFQTQRSRDASSYPSGALTDKRPLVVELDAATEFCATTRGCEDAAHLSLNNGAVNNAGRSNPFSGSVITPDTDTHWRGVSSEHCHSLEPPHHDTKARNQLIIVSVLCAVFMSAEILGGVFSNSLALVSDATHMASDLIGLLVSLLAIWLSRKAPTSKFTYGFHRAEVLGALLSVLIIWFTTGLLVYLAVQRVTGGDYDINADEMLVVAGLGVAFNLVMGIVLQGGCGLCRCRIPDSGFGHSHGSHSHGGTPSEHGTPSENGAHHSHSHKPGNINVRAAFIHVVGDTVQSLGVLTAAFIIKFKPSYKIADPVCTFVFSLLVLFTTAIIVKDIINILLQGTPGGVNYAEVEKNLQGIPGVVHVHSLRIMVLSVGKNTITAHLAVDQSGDWVSVVQAATRLLRDQYHVVYSTIQVEPYQPEVMTSCGECLGPRRRRNAGSEAS